jgi:large subunit ribosomal protein L29
MKTKERKDLFTKSEKELLKILKEAREALFNFKLDLTQNKLKNTRQIFWKKKEIALILTILKEKELKDKEEVK